MIRATIFIACTYLSRACSLRFLAQGTTGLVLLMGERVIPRAILMLSDLMQSIKFISSGSAFFAHASTRDVELPT